MKKSTLASRKWRAAERALHAANPERTKWCRHCRAQTRRSPRGECLECLRCYRAQPRVKEAHRSRNRRRARKRCPTPTRPEPEVCECCGDWILERSLHLDHDHTTHTFRGWLCFACNTGIGQFQDDPERLRKAIAYLEKYGSRR